MVLCYITRKLKEKKEETDWIKKFEPAAGETLRAAGKKHLLLHRIFISESLTSFNEALRAPFFFIICLDWGLMRCIKKAFSF